MDNPLKILVIGLVSGAIVAVGSLLNTHRLQSDIDDLVSACESEFEEKSKVSGSVEALAKSFGGKIVCEPDTRINQSGKVSEATKKYHDMLGSKKMAVRDGCHHIYSICDSLVLVFLVAKDR